MELIGIGINWKQVVISQRKTFSGQAIAFMNNINEMEIIQQVQFIGFVTDCVTIIKTLTKYQAPFTHELISTVLKYVQNDCKRRLRVT